MAGLTYTTAQVARMTGATVRNLQRWDELYLHVPVVKHCRRFSEQDVRRAALLQRLKSRGLLRQHQNRDLKRRLERILARFVEARYLLFAAGKVSEFLDPDLMLRAAARARGPVILLHTPGQAA